MNTGRPLRGCSSGRCTPRPTSRPTPQGVEQGLLASPSRAGYAKLIRDVLAWHAAGPRRLRKMRLVEEKWNGRPLPDGALRPSTSTPINGAYVLLGLLYGRDSERRWRSPRARARTPTATPPVPPHPGVMLASKDPGDMEGGIPSSRTQSSSSAVLVQRNRGVHPGPGGEDHRRRRGTVGPEEVVVPVQSPKARRWSSGTPACRSPVLSLTGAWSWKAAGGARRRRTRDPEGEARRRGGGRGGPRVRGTGVALVAPWARTAGARTSTGRAKAGRSTPDPRADHDNDYWHVTGLANGPTP